MNQSPVPLIRLKIQCLLCVLATEARAATHSVTVIMSLTVELGKSLDFNRFETSSYFHRFLQILRIQLVHSNKTRSIIN